MSKKPMGYWKNKNNRIGHTRELVKRLDKPITALSRKDFIENGLYGVLNNCNNSPFLALREAGYDIEPWEMKRVPNNYWKKRENRIKAVKRLIDKLDKPIPEITLEDFRQNNLHGLLRHKNASVHEILKEAGYNLKPWEHRSVPIGYWKEKNHRVEAIRFVVEKIGKSPDKIELKNFQENRLAGLLVEYYGDSPYDALKEAGYDINQEDRGRVKRGYWSKEKMVERIIDYYNQDSDISSQGIRKYHESLFQRSVQVFGSWEKALDIAGIDYGKIRKERPKGHWTKEEVLMEIKDMVDNGEDISYIGVLETRPYLNAAACKKKCFGSWENAIRAAGFDYDEIRKDRLLEQYKGHVFEKIVGEILKAKGHTGPGIDQSKKVVYLDSSRKAHIEPDFVLEDGTWIDAKLSSWTSGVEKTVRLYFNHSPSLTIIHLRGNSRKWADNRVVFIPVNRYYPKLREIGRDDIVSEIQLLKRGIIPQKHQTDLEAFFQN